LALDQKGGGSTSPKAMYEDLHNGSMSNLVPYSKSKKILDYMTEPTIAQLPVSEKQKQASKLKHRKHHSTEINAPCSNGHMTLISLIELLSPGGMISTEPEN